MVSLQKLGNRGHNSIFPVEILCGTCSTSCTVPTWLTTKTLKKVNFVLAAKLRRDLELLEFHGSISTCRVMSTMLNVLKDKHFLRGKEGPRGQTRE